MSRTLLLLALVALLFAGVVMAQSSSSTGEESSSSVDFSSSADASSSSASVSSSSGAASSSSSDASSTGASSTGVSSTGPSSSSGDVSSSSGPNGTVIESSSSTGSAPVVQNVTLAVGLTAPEAFNDTVRATLAPQIATLLGITYTTYEWSTQNVARRLLAVNNIITYQGVPEDKKNDAAALLANEGTRNSFVNQLSSVSGLQIDGAADVTGNPGNSASGLAASPLVLVAAAVLAMLF